MHDPMSQLHQVRADADLQLTSAVSIHESTCAILSCSDIVSVMSCAFSLAIVNTSSELITLETRTKMNKT